MKEACDKLGVTEYAETKKKLDSLNDEIQNDNVLIDKLRSQITELQEKMINLLNQSQHSSVNYHVLRNYIKVALMPLTILYL